MYFRKYFEGTVSAYNTTASVLVNGTSSRQTVYINQTNIINEAIKETLMAAGIDCEYDSTSCSLHVGGVFVQILAASNAGNIAVYRKGISSPMQTSSTSCGICSGSNYKFYVTLKGDPKGILVVTIGYYSKPEDMTYGVAVAKIIDLRDNSRKTGIMLPNNSYNVYIYDESGEKLSEIETLNFMNLKANNDLTESGSLIPLVEIIDTYGFFKIEQCYMGTYGLAKDSFYNIGGEVFYMLYNYYLIKCTTEVS